MKERTKYLILLVLGIELVAGITIYFFGDHGIRTIMGLYREQEQLEHEIDNLNQEVAKLVFAIDEWNQYPFYKEKVAREQLQMAAPGDELYLVDKE